MNIFVLSPGRTATTTLTHAFSKIDGYTSTHESRTTLLGSERIDFPENHIECDNRLVWFLPRLYKKYGNSSVLVKVTRNKQKIAASYNKRWYKINIMKAYSQGILLRKLSQNNFSVCEDYVNNIYEQIDFHSLNWKYTVTIDLDNPSTGVRALLNIIGKKDCYNEVMSVIQSQSLNLNKSGFLYKLGITYFNIKVLLKDIIT